MVAGVTMTGAGGVPLWTDGDSGVVVEIGEALGVGDGASVTVTPGFSAGEVDTCGGPSGVEEGAGVGVGGGVGVGVGHGGTIFSQVKRSGAEPPISSRYFLHCSRHLFKSGGAAGSAVPGKTR